MRQIIHVHANQPPHWVGNGFYVKTLMNHLENRADFNYSHTDPFLLLDYGEPTTFAPNPNYDSQPQGMGQHPHKGFETVTIAYQGEISHADSAGGHGEILEGDVQWMTAGRGILHEEFHSQAFGQYGGVFSMVQMWINLPKKHKLTDAKYQSIKRADMPVVKLYDESYENASHDQDSITRLNALGTATIIAGECRGIIGIASTFSPVNVWDIELTTAGTTTLEIPNTHNLMILVQQGSPLINDSLVSAGSLVQFSPSSLATTSDTLDVIATLEKENTPATTDSITLTYPTTSHSEETQSPNDAPIQSSNDAPIKILLLSGEPIGEPIASYGPFVMNTQEELKQTFREYQTGRFG